LQDISPDELKILTTKTYTIFKKEFIENQKEFTDSF
jgi:hypothetical protein